MKKIISSIGVFFLSFWAVLSWNGIIAENGDLLNISKWNQLVTILNSKISNADILAGDNITTTLSWSQIVINATSGWGGYPYISNQNEIIIAPNSTANIVIEWQNFVPNSSIEIPWFDGSINSNSAVNPNQINANITSWNTTWLFDVVVNNSGNKSDSWSGNWQNLLRVIAPVLWTWVAWTYTETFESNSKWSWSDIIWLDATFSVTSGWTPSSNTWPTWAQAWTYYMFAETSNPNFPSKTFAIETSNFRQAQSISFDYHMFGAAMGTLEIQTLYNSNWTTVFTLNGQQQAAQNDPWISTGNIDLSSYLVERIRIFYTSGNNYTWDVALDNISIISQ